jgi:hypothetical protein
VPVPARLQSIASSGVAVVKVVKVGVVKAEAAVVVVVVVKAGS